MNIIILLKLLFAHFFSDFILQTNRMCEGKKMLGTARIIFHLLHSLIHAIIAYLLVAEWNEWVIPVVIFATHFMMDMAKTAYMKNKLTSFIVDQVIHLVIIVVLWWMLYGDNTFVRSLLNPIWNSTHIWIIIISYTLILKPTSVFLALFIKKWTPKELTNHSLANAGEWIGYMERILILTFILTNHIEGVGFLLAAKSIFRFGELNKAKEIKITEYVLIGTLASFTIAIIIGFISLYFLE